MSVLEIIIYSLLVAALLTWTIFSILETIRYNKAYKERLKANGGDKLDAKRYADELIKGKKANSVNNTNEDTPFDE